jgi:hypothetical protein
MSLSDLEAIDPALYGDEVEAPRANSSVSVLLILAICLSFAVIASAAVSVFVLTGNAWFGSAVEPFFLFFIGSGLGG